MARSKTVMMSLHTTIYRLMASVQGQWRSLGLCIWQSVVVWASICVQTAAKHRTGCYFVSWTHVKLRWYWAQFHVTRKMAKLLLSHSVRGLGRRKVDIIKGASHGLLAIITVYIYILIVWTARTNFSFGNVAVQSWVQKAKVNTSCLEQPAAGQSNHTLVPALIWHKLINMVADLFLCQLLTFL